MLSERMAELTNLERKVKAWFERARAILVGRWTGIRFKMRRWVLSHASKIETGMWFLAFVAGAVLASPLQPPGAHRVVDLDGRIPRHRSLRQLSVAMARSSALYDPIAASPWADQLSLGTRELLQLAIEKRTQFTLDMIYWIAGMSEILIAIAQAPATREHTREQLKRHADWLFCSLTFILRDKETVQWIEHFSFVEDVFNFAMMAVNRKWYDGFARAWNLLLKWGFEGGRQQTGWNTLENCLAALAALALRRGDEHSALLLSQVQGAVFGDGTPCRETLDHTARGLREKAIEIRENDFEINPVDRVLARIDGAGARELLVEVANILSPDTADEPVRMRP